MSGYGWAALVLSLVLAAALVLLLRLWRGLRREREENRRLRDMVKLSARRAEDEEAVLRRLRHDLRHYLRAASDVPEGQAPSSGGERLEAISESWVVSALAGRYREQAEALGARTDILLPLGAEGPELLPDLCLVLSNLLENAVECLRREGGGWLRARSYATPGYVSIVVGNSCAQPLRAAGERYLSSKGEGRLGVGLSSVQDIARRRGGEAVFTVSDGEFRASVFLPRAKAT